MSNDKPSFHDKLYYSKSPTGRNTRTVYHEAGHVSQVSSFGKLPADNYTMQEFQDTYKHWRTTEDFKKEMKRQGRDYKGRAVDDTEGYERK